MLPEMVQQYVGTVRTEKNNAKSRMVVVSVRFNRVVQQRFLPLLETLNNLEN